MAEPRAHWIDTPAAMTELVAALRAAPDYGFDTEFMRQGPEVPRPALVQLAWADQVALVDPLAVDLAPLAEVFHGAGTACGHALAQDLEIVEKMLGAPPARIFDTQVAAGFLGYRQASLKVLLADFRSVPMSKGARRSNWKRRPLSAAQHAYAAQDVRHLLALVADLRGALREAGRLAWAEEDSERLRTEGISRPGPPEGAPPDDLVAAVKARAKALDVVPHLLATRADLAWCAQGEPPDRLVTGWRREVIGDLFPR